MQKDQKKAGTSPTFFASASTIMAGTSADNDVDAIRLRGLQIDRSQLARTAICLSLEVHLLTFHEATKAGTLDSAHMHKNVSAAIVRLNKAEAFLIVEKLYCADGHDDSFQSVTGFLLSAPHGATSGSDHDFERGRPSMARVAQ
jgi:hypothetical protein